MSTSVGSTTSDQSMSSSIATESSENAAMAAGTSHMLAATSSHSKQQPPQEDTDMTPTGSSHDTRLAQEEEELAIKNYTLQVSQSQSEEDKQKTLQQQPPQHFLVVSLWISFTQWLHASIIGFCLFWSLLAARHPKRTIGLVSAISILTLGIGFVSNFELKLNDEDMFAPVSSRPVEHYNYIHNTPNYFPPPNRFLAINIHGDGANVLGYQGMQQVFQALDTVRALPAYTEFCGDDGEDCVINSATRFWNHNATIFERAVNQSTAKVLDTLSREELWAAPSLLFGNFARNATNSSLIDFGQALFTIIDLPTTDEAETLSFEKQALEALLPLRQEWLDSDDDSLFKLEVYSLRSIPDEAERALASDIPLIPVVFVIMACFTCLIFTRKDKVQSRSLLGIGSVVTIMCSIMTGFGFCFMIGLPFTSMTQILPFVIFGVGLDDTFIITGAYLRTNPDKETIQRIEETMMEVGSSISLTTITTTMAFCLGCLSTIPVIQWMCVYAFTTIMIDFFYQITFFVAILVLDEKRMAKGKRGCLVCYKADTKTVIDDDDEDVEDQLQLQVSSVPTGQQRDEYLQVQTLSPLSGKSETTLRECFSQENTMPSPTSSNSNINSNNPQQQQQRQAPLPDRIMDWYSQRLLQPKVKIFVLCLSAVFFGGCGYSASHLKQDFRPEEFMPDGSYAFSFIDTLALYTQRKQVMNVYFRDVDQSNPAVRQQMIDYVDQIAAMPQVDSYPAFCWVRDFKAIEDGNNTLFESYTQGLVIPDQSFEAQLDLLLSFKDIRSVYGKDISRYPEGHPQEGQIEASRCQFTINNIDIAQGVEDQIQMLNDQHDVTLAQPVNQGRERFAFFAFDLIFFIWEFYAAAIDELIMSTISSVIAVGVVTFILIPHRTAVIFVMPMIIVLYIDLMGVIQFAGLSINPLTYLCLIMSIGLLVDFLLHVLLRYYESAQATRDEKVKEMLRTMGSSIFVGGLSTMLGVVPLAFSTSAIIRIVFTMFFAMVTLGIFNGLVVLPVVLSYLGPEVCIGHLPGPVVDLKKPEDRASVEIQTSQSASSTEETNNNGAPPPISTTSVDDLAFQPPPTRSPKETSPNMRKKGNSWSWDKGMEVVMEIEV